jgi:hypothetical protein
MTDNEILHTYADDSKLIRTSIQWLLKLQIWKGNRIIDHDHVAMIRESLIRDGTDIRSLDSGYRIIVYNEEDASGHMIEQRYIIDGQHRFTVVQESISPIDNFPITIVEKYVANESEAVEYFNRINASKPLQYKEDPNLIANRFVQAIEKAFRTKKKPIRNGKTKRPYVCIDDIRKVLVANIEKLRGIRVEQFIEKLQAWNIKQLKDIELELGFMDTVKDKGIKETAVDIKSALGISTGCKWVNELLK